MNRIDYYSKQDTYIRTVDDRIGKIVEIVNKLNPEAVLDIGCGDGFLIENLKKLSHKTKYYGLEISEKSVKKALAKKITCKAGNVEDKIHYREKFDLIIAGEVIEHLVDPDSALKNIYKSLNKNGYLIVSTPNLAAWYNRILLLLGIQPIFTETSLHENLGRKFKILGQGRYTEGHLKIFTKNSLVEILQKENFKVIKIQGASFLPGRLRNIEKFFNKFPSLSSEVIVVAQKYEK